MFIISSILVVVIVIVDFCSLNLKTIKQLQFVISRSDTLIMFLFFGYWHLIWHMFLCPLIINSRIIMLETVAGVPGMIAAMARHFHSLRKLTRDHGWIHTLLGNISSELKGHAKLK